MDPGQRKNSPRPAPGKPRRRRRKQQYEMLLQKRPDLNLGDAVALAAAYARLRRAVEAERTEHEKGEG